MKRHHLITPVILLALITSACGQPTTKTPTPTVSIVELPKDISTGVLISEVLAGVEGNNNMEFIELYNAGDEIVDLKGWTMWYRLATSQEDLLVYRWKARSLIPPHGHYLLGRAGQDLGITPDGTFDQALNTSGGGLALRKPDKETADVLGWGKAPTGFIEGEPAQALENDLSLERSPGGSNGSAADNGDNAGDFVFNLTPDPQNTGSPLTPSVGEVLAISVTAPEVAEPGGQFEYTLNLTNETGQTVHDLVVEFPIPAGLEVVSVPEGMVLEEGITTWKLGALESGASQSVTIPIYVPWTYLTAIASNYYVRAGDWTGTAFGGPVYTQVEGGVIPIGTARSLMNAELIVEGIATMYTGGYFAGGGNTKFYLEDETGGLQVQVFGGEGVVQVATGARVRVKGTIGAYRGSMQIVPMALPGDVETIIPASQGTAWPATQTSIQQAANDFETLPGKLVAVEGTVTRLEEFTYSYEIDLADDQGQSLTLYVDKLTNLTVEAIEVGSLYSAAGILEVRDGEILLYPRVQSDLIEVFPPVLMIEGESPNTALADGVFTTTLTVFNHTPETLTNLQITAPLLSQNASLETVLDGGALEGDSITWAVPELAGEGGSASVRFQLRISKEAEPQTQIVSEGYNVVALEWAEPVYGTALRTFIGSIVPVWAIQGEGGRSPYILDQVSTQGIVTGIFPELGGFWIEETTVDDNPLTSEGLFVLVGEGVSEPPPDIPVTPGDLVEVHGLVRELSQQTTLQITGLGDLVILSQGNAPPGPVELDPPVATVGANTYYEALEGMLVRVTGPSLATSPTSKYGEYVLVLPTHGVERLWQGEDNGFMIMVDDGSQATHADRSTLAYVISTGDQVSDLVGPLAYTFGRYKIEPIALPQVTHSDTELPSLPAAGPDEFSIMTWNVENLFDIRLPHPSDPPIPRLADYELALTKVANTILSAGVPTIVALQEVENIGILEDLAAHELLASYAYQPALVEGTDSRGIDNGYLVRGDRANVQDTTQRVAPEGLTSRPPLLIQVEVTTASGTATLFIANNHFTSMSGGEAATEPRRTAQAAWNVTILEEILAAEPEALVAILGDLNSFYQSLPIDTLREAGLQHVFEELPPEERYNYIYQGESQTLDHIMVTSPLMELLRRVDVLHVNADFPPMQPGDPSPERKSDHDPIVAAFSLAP